MHILQLSSGVLPAVFTFTDWNANSFIFCLFLFSFQVFIFYGFI